MNREQALEKVRKCLALASASNAYEAASALRQARALLRRHRIAWEETEIRTSTRPAGRAANPPKWHRYLGGLIREAFGVEPVYRRDRPGALEIEFIGVGPQAEVAAYAYTVLYRQLKRDRAKHLATLWRYKRANKTRKADLFAEAWVQAVWDSVIALAQPPKHRELIRRYAETQRPGLVPLRDRGHAAREDDFESMLSGKSAGRKVRLRRAMRRGGPPRALSHG